MDTLGRMKIQCWKSQSPAGRKLPCSPTFRFELKRKAFSLPLLFVPPPPCSLSMSPKVDEQQSDSAILSAALPESDSMLVHVRFVLQKECMFGERFYLVGDDPLFGLWDPSNGIPLDWSDGHIWSARLEVPMGKKVEFKFALLCLSGEVHWQPGPNRVLLLDWVTSSTNPQASSITVWEDWGSVGGNQTISLEDGVAVSTGASVKQDEIRVPGPDCSGGTSDLSNKIGDNPELVQGDVDSGIISRTGQEGSESDSKSNSGGMILVPGLNSATAKAVNQQDDLIDPLENGDRIQSSAEEIIIDDSEDRIPAKAVNQQDDLIDPLENGDRNQSSAEEITIDDSEDRNPAKAVNQQDDLIDPLENGDRNQSSAEEITIDDSEDRNPAKAVNQQDDLIDPLENGDRNQSSAEEITIDDSEDRNPAKAVNQQDDLIDPLENGDRNQSSAEEITIDDSEDRNPAKAVNQQDDLIDPLENGDRNQSSAEEITIDDSEDRGNKREDRASLKNISSEEVILEPTTANILRNDLQWGQRALKDFFSSLGFEK